MKVTIARQAFQLPRAPEDDVEIFAIGDIHGRAELLDALLEAAAHEPKRAARRALVLTGDLIDRGPRSLETIRLAREGQARIDADELHALMGNHETMMRFALDPATPAGDALDVFGSWVSNGGGEVLKEFAAPPDGAPLYADEWRELAMQALPEDIRAWLAGLGAYWRSGDLLFVHAGVDPAANLDAFLAQPWDAPFHGLDEERHWAWIRAPFLDYRPGSGGFSGAFVVHGHTPLDSGYAPGPAAQIARCRLNLDAGSFFTGEAKMAAIRGANFELFTARADP